MACAEVVSTVNVKATAINLIIVPSPSKLPKSGKISKDSPQFVFLAWEGTL
jgi:hypothetical protein